MERLISQDIINNPVLEWILAGIVMAGAGAALACWKFRSIDGEIRHGIERARKRDFHESGGRWSKLPWEEKD